MGSEIVHTVSSVANTPYTCSAGTHSWLFPAVMWPPDCSLSRRWTASFPSAPTKSATSCHGATSVYVSHVKERQPRRGNAGECTRDPTLTRVQWKAESWGKHVEDNHTHSADKHRDAHARPNRHPGIRALIVLSSYFIWSCRYSWELWSYWKWHNN